MKKQKMRKKRKKKLRVSWRERGKSVNIHLSVENKLVILNEFISRF